MAPCVAGVASAPLTPGGGVGCCGWPCSRDARSACLGHRTAGIPRKGVPDGRRLYAAAMSTQGRVRAPELYGRGGFVGGDPVSLADVRGRVVLLDFWTSSCINCIHVLQELAGLEHRFGDDLTVIGVHSPKFPHEAEHAAVAEAVERYGITHPVLDDPELHTWREYAVRAWPTLVLIDPEGYVALQASGEGHAERLAKAIDTLLAAHQAKGTLVRGPRTTTVHAPVAPSGLRFPGGVAHDAARGLLAVADSGHHRIVLAEPGGTVVATIGSGLARHAD